jgi:hypothetical protein
MKPTGRLGTNRYTRVMAPQPRGVYNERDDSGSYGGLTDRGGCRMGTRFLARTIGCLMLLGAVSAGVLPAMGHGVVVGGTGGFVSFGLLPSLVPFISTGQVVVVTTRTFNSQVGGVNSRFVVTSIALTPTVVGVPSVLPFPNPMLVSPQTFPNPMLAQTNGVVVGDPPMGGAVAVSDPPMGGVGDPPAARHGTAVDPRGVNACVMSSCRLEQALTNRRLIREQNLTFGSEP